MTRNPVCHWCNGTGMRYDYATYVYNECRACEMTGRGTTNVVFDLDPTTRDLVDTYVRSDRFKLALEKAIKESQELALQKSVESLAGRQEDQPDVPVRSD